jgi:hypothetical protein
MEWTAQGRDARKKQTFWVADMDGVQSSGLTGKAG